MKVKSLRDLYVDELRDLYSAENQIIKALPKMVKLTQSEALRAAFQEHLEVTRGQVERLEQIFERLQLKPKGKKCKAMEGLITEAQETAGEIDEPSVRDAALIAAAQRVEHYEIAGYGTVRTFAQQLGETEAAELLQQTLDEEGETDKKLTDLAESMVNVEAGAAAEE